MDRDNARLLSAAALANRDTATCGYWDRDRADVLTTLGMRQAAEDLAKRAALLRLKADNLAWLSDRLAVECGEKVAAEVPV